MIEQITREQALERLDSICPYFATNGVVDLLLAIQSETEARVVAKCCEIAEAERVEWLSIRDATAGCISASQIRQKIRAAFPEAKP